MKQRGATAYEITNELVTRNRIINIPEGPLFLIDTLKSLGYNKESIMYEVIQRYRKGSQDGEMGQYFIKAGFTDPTDVAKQLVRDYAYNTNDGHTPVAIQLAVAPNATMADIAKALKSVGFTGRAITSGFISNGRLDQSVTELFKSFGFNARESADYLNSAGYSYENAVITLKAIGYPLSEYFNYINDNSVSNKVTILKRNGYSAVEIAKVLYASNTVDYWLIQALDQGGFTDLPTLVKAYYESGQPKHWTLHDIYKYGKINNSNYRWQLLDIVEELQNNVTLSLVDLADLINYANNNNYRQTFSIIKAVSTREQAQLRSEIPIDFAGAIAAYVPDFVALGVMKANGRTPSQALDILKNEAGVSDWKIATLILFMSGYNVVDSVNAIFDMYRIEIGLEVLMALFSSGFGQLIKDFDKYWKVVKFVGKQISIRV